MWPTDPPPKVTQCSYRGEPVVCELLLQVCKATNVQQFLYHLLCYMKGGGAAEEADSERTLKLKSNSQFGFEN